MSLYAARYLIIHKGLSMQDSPSLADVLEKLYENQLALAAAIDGLALWVEVRAEDEPSATNVRSALETLDRNADVVNRAITALRSGHLHAPGN